VPEKKGNPIEAVRMVKGTKKLQDFPVCVSLSREKKSDTRGEKNSKKKERKTGYAGKTEEQALKNHKGCQEAMNKKTVIRGRRLLNQKNTQGHTKTENKKVGNRGMKQGG